ncbi:hypothetical protein [Salibacter halophilus]|uniref:Uncharacterized protein n=1 Tax=Salibacter halophilus TaxID=1803916 RepID=A0A6N6M9W2_9FLAO|nr:hypothetical protein [Salibacter halophilus]KAB1065046.1 hypothetical protein F3059_03600 [Salibacter halophilus]
MKINTPQNYFFGLYASLGASDLDPDNYNSYVNNTFTGQGAKGVREEIMLDSYMNHSGFNIELGLPIGFTIDLSDKLYLETSAGFYVASWASTISSARHKNAIVEYSSLGSTEETYELNQLSSNGFGFFTGVDLCYKSTESTSVNIGVGYSMLDKTWNIEHRLGPDLGNTEYNALLDLLRVRIGVSILSETDSFF